MAENPNVIFVEIGCGLNTRFERVDHGKVRWFDLDLPDSMAMRKRLFKETDRSKLIAASVLDSSWVDTVKAAGDAPIMFAAEGVLMYLTEEQVKQVFVLLIKHFPGALFAFDSISPFMVKNQKQHDAMKNFAAKFQWGIKEFQYIQSWDERYKNIETIEMGKIVSKYIYRMGLINSFIFKIPPFKNMYRLSLAQLG